jgi:hypothetical protein
LAKKRKGKKAVKKKSNILGWRAQVFWLVILLTAVVFMPSTILLIFGMMPTIVSAAFGSAEKKSRAITVGAFNICGCTIFLLHLWGIGHEIDNAVLIVTDPRSIIVMWCMAGVGYLFDWALTGVVARFMVDKGNTRVEEIKKQQKELIERWGPEVSGEIPLDSRGFPVEGYMKEVSNKVEESK